MRAEHLLISLGGLLIGFFMIFSGCFLFLAAYIPNVSLALKAMVFNHMQGLSFFGLGLSFLGIFFLTLFFLLNRRCYFLLEMGGVSVEDSLIAYYAEECLKKIFPGQPVTCDVIVKKKKQFEILANIPFIPEEKQEDTLKVIEKELSFMLQKQCQYYREFILNFSFFAQKVEA